MITLETIKRSNQKRAIIGLSICILLIVLIFVALMIRLFSSTEQTIEGTEGLRSYRMFTIDSNLLCAACALACIPYLIDGIRTGDLHLPRWIVYLLFMGVNCVSLTFFVAVTVLAPGAGFYYILISGSSLYMHPICPILSIIMFLYVTPYHTIKMRWTFFGLAPVFIYAMTYMVCVFFLGIWNDHYEFGTYVPWPVTLVVMLSIAFGVATALRLIHNFNHHKSKQKEKMNYQTCVQLDKPTLEEAVQSLASERKKTDKGEGDLVVPRRIIAMLKDKYKSNKNLSELYILYINEYYRS